MKPVNLDVYRDLYHITKDGRVYSLRNNKFIANTPINDTGYYKVSLWYKGKEKTISVHRLLALTYLGDPIGDKKYACHKDGNPGNNHIDNIYWGTNSENMLDKLKHGTMYQLKTTHCPYGHKLEHPNLVISRLKKNNKRICRSCVNGNSYVNNKGLDKSQKIVWADFYYYQYFPNEL